MEINSKRTSSRGTKEVVQRKVWIYRLNDRKWKASQCSQQSKESDWRTLTKVVGWIAISIMIYMISHVNLKDFFNKIWFCSSFTNNFFSNLVQIKIPFISRCLGVMVLWIKKEKIFLWNQLFSNFLDLSLWS